MALGELHTEGAEGCWSSFALLVLAEKLIGLACQLWKKVSCKHIMRCDESNLAGGIRSAKGRLEHGNIISTIVTLGVLESVRAQPLLEWFRVGAVHAGVGSSRSHVEEVRCRAGKKWITIANRHSCIYAQRSVRRIVAFSGVVVSLLHKRISFWEVPNSISSNYGTWQMLYQARNLWFFSRNTLIEGRKTQSIDH